MDEKQRVYNDCPYEKSSFISKLLMWWVYPLLKLGHKKVLEEEDLYKPISDDYCSRLTGNLEREWNKELKKTNPRLWKAFFRLYFFKLMIMSINPVIQELIRLSLPLLTTQLLKYFSGQADLRWAIIFGSCICFGLVIIPLMNHSPYFITLMRYSMQLRIAFCGILYRKTLKLNFANSNLNINGKLMNLISTDASIMETFTYYLPYLIAGPIQLIVAIVIIINMIDYAALSGLAIFLFSIPFQSFLAHLMRIFKTQVLKKRDERIGLLSELLNGIKIIKSYCWEEAFRKLIEDIRKVELKHQAKVFTAFSLNTSFELSLTLFTVYASVVFIIIFTKAPLLPAYMVILLGFYTRIGDTVGFFFVKGVVAVMNAKLVLARAQEYLLLEELPQKCLATETTNTPLVNVNNLTTCLKQESNSFSLQSVSFNIEDKGLLAIVGPIAAGKTTVLLSLIGEIPNTSGDIKINGRMFYVSQEPWIFPATLKQNILFGKPYEKQKFNEIIKVCCLVQDIKELENGINTIIGDKGVNLSGGQKARVSLARALYNDPDIYLFDDPLSAVDANIGKKLYDKCINGYLRNKIRILVTHQVHYLTNAKEIIVLKNGQLIAKGSYSDLLESSTVNIDSLLGEHQKQVKEENTNSDNTLPNKSTENVPFFTSVTSLSSNKFAQDITRNIEENNQYEEQHTTGAVKCKIYCGVFNVFLNIFFVTTVVLLYIATQGLSLSAEFWLSHWTNKEEQVYIQFKQNKTCLNNSTHTDITFTSTTCLNNTLHDSNLLNLLTSRNRDFLIYSILTTSAFILAFIRTETFFSFCILASKSLHEKMLKSVLQAKFRFFDLNPVGRIISRFTKDMANVDDTLSETLNEFLHYAMIVIGSFVIALIVNFWILFAILPLLAFFFFIRNYFMNSSREMKRLEGLCRSPIYVHASNTINGITTIRTCKYQEVLSNEFDVHVDYHTQAFFGFLSISRWFAVQLELAVSVYSVLLVYGSIFLQRYLNITPGAMGLSLLYLLRLSGIVQWTIRQSAEVENLMTSVERIAEYSNITGENRLSQIKRKVTKDWPEKGIIIFKNVSFSYDHDLPNALNDITLTINAGEKIGVVGRSGAGKSTFFKALLRTGEITGSIIIDDIDTSQISLHDLRNRISVIPQEPTLFIGTVRYNLDPFNQYDDRSLWNALESVQLKEAIKAMDGGLDANIESNGSNLSVGQKQLFCLARAILKNSKILIIDEATANVDYKTDELVQTAIRKYFKECTVITIAHRLHTVIDSDRILCISNGKVVNFDHPYNLLQDENSLFYDLVNKLGSNEASRLMKITELNMTSQVNDK